MHCWSANQLGFFVWRIINTLIHKTDAQFTLKNGECVSSIKQNLRLKSGIWAKWNINFYKKASAPSIANIDSGNNKEYDEINK